jgi:hypothetical protein
MQIHHLLKVSILLLEDDLNPILGDNSIDLIHLNFVSKVDNVNEKMDYQ